MTTREHLETLLITYGELLMGGDPGAALEAVATDIETLINQVSEERVREARKDQIMRDELAINADDNFIDVDESHIIAWREDQLASLNKPQETRPQTNGDLVEDPATGITIFPKAAKPDSRPLPNSHGK